MKFTIIKDPIPFLIIDDTYSKDEQLQIYSELDFFVDKLLGPVETGSAVDKNGRKKDNRSLFLDTVYSNRRFSNILKVNRKLFDDNVVDNLIQCHYAYNLINNTNFDTTLISYYDDEGSYFSHSDKSVISIVTWFYKTPKNFTGGDFKFTDYNINVEVKNNRTVIFFSSYIHQVSKVSILDKSLPASGRFSITNFCTIQPGYSIQSKL